MQKRRIGCTDLLVSCIGLGTVKFGRNEGLKYPHAFSLPTDETLENLLALAKDLGINLLDTAPAYGQSEERLGKLLQGSRTDWVISTKVGEEFRQGQSQFDFSKRAIQLSIDRSLKRLKTDYLDILFIHSDGQDETLIQDENVFSTLDACKQSGKIRAYGMSTKTVKGGLLTIQHADLAMVTFNPDYLLERDVISYAHQMQKGIFIKKALNSGHLSAFDAMQFVCSEPGVTSVIVGTINEAHLRENVESLCNVK